MWWGVVLVQQRISSDTGHPWPVWDPLLQASQQSSAAMLSLEVPCRYNAMDEVMLVTPGLARLVSSCFINQSSPPNHNT